MHCCVQKILVDYIYKDDLQALNHYIRTWTFIAELDLKYPKNEQNDLNCALHNCVSYVASHAITEKMIRESI